METKTQPDYTRVAPAMLVGILEVHGFDPHKAEFTLSESRVKDITGDFVNVRGQKLAEITVTYRVTQKG